ncbi:hypothetical protein [Mongoliitalea daihaiensis]|uniref:hypothetical protein n=1 Tax=Mongoliitalea daihaiensis TaxID=2782006 RepID=UPI001F3FF5F8|nr:hypothetical protein [Mongoliitalea daihaiensis]UJP64596.1 hypothetical protein IPZ59_17605 [Mongoliitalea daihaiensis]
MGYIPFFLTLGGFIMLFFIVVNSTFKNKKQRLVWLSGQVFTIMYSLDNTLTQPTSEKLDEVHVAIESFRRHKEDLKKANPEVFENELLPTIKSLKLAKAAYNQLLEEKPYSFIAKIMGHQPLS